MLGTGCQMESRQHQCAFVDWPLPPGPATAATARRWGERRLLQGCQKGLQVWQLALAIGVGLSGPRWGILFHEVLSEVWASLQPLM